MKIIHKVGEGKTCCWHPAKSLEWTDVTNWGGVAMKKETAPKIVTKEVIDLSKKRPDMKK